MVLERKPLYKMNQESSEYLSENTEITYLNEGGIAKSILTATNREISNLQDLATSLFRNTRPSTANGVFLDMIGEILAVTRLPSAGAIVYKSDSNIRFYASSGSLGDLLPHPSDPLKGLISVNTQIKNSDGSIIYRTIEDTVFPRGASTVYVSAESVSTGSSQSIGEGKLTVHNLGNNNILVRNDRTIDTARDSETDESYRFRISNAILSLAGGNRTAVETSVLSFPGIQSVEVREYARGVGSFDVFVVPVHNKLGSTLARQLQTTIDRTKALGIDARVKEPTYVPFKIVIQLGFYDSVGDGERVLIRDRAEENIKGYLESVPIGGEIVLNQIRAVVIGTSSAEIRDMRIIEMCVRQRPVMRRNIQLGPEELLVLDETLSTPIEVL